MKKILIYALTIFMVVILVGCASKEKIVLSDTLEFEVNSEVKLSELIESTDGIEIIDEDLLIDTSKLGEKEITFKYYNSKKEEKEYTFKIKIVDTIAPDIEYEENVEVASGSEDNLLKGIKITDNSGEEIQATIEGDYDLNKAGEYKLKYVATDSSGNKVEKEFVLKVKDVNIKTTGFYVYKTKSSWYAIQFLSNNKVRYLINRCPGSGCGGYGYIGTYKKSGNKVTLNFTHEEAIGGPYKLDKTIKWEFTINSESQLQKENEKYDYSKDF